MSTYSSYNPYGSNLAQKKRRRFFTKLSLVIIICISLVGLGAYALFFTPWLKITETNINGLKTLEPAEIFSVIDSITNHEIGPVKIKLYLNILFLNSDYLGNKILSQFSVIKKAEVIKNFPHKLVVNIEERNPLGTWCDINQCRYFDETGTLWGKALKSSGSLLLSIDDSRIVEKNYNEIDDLFLDSIQEAVAGLDELDIKTKRVEIPAESIGDFRIYSNKGYYVIFNTESDIDEQINVLKIFLDNKGDDFKAEYVDLRIDGRVYYK